MTYRVFPVIGAINLIVDAEINNDYTTTSTTATPTASGAKSFMETNNIWYILVGVGIIVLLIIIGQTIALCYFRKKAQPRRRMDKIRPRSQLDRGDRARYSAPPCKKSKESIPPCDRDSHIYEMVVVNANYNKPSELQAAVDEANKHTQRERPPLPLPHELAEPETLSRPHKKRSPFRLSTMSLISSSSGSTVSSKKKNLPEQGSKKAPARLPKQIDGESLPGSLKRPAKAVPASPATSKATIPKHTGTESTMSELKNILKNRNIGKDTPTIVTATLEKKEPPKVQTKPNKLIKPDNQPKQPPIASKPGVPPNQIKLILPKIEASLKTPKIVPAPKPTESIPPIKPPPLVKKPQPTVNASRKPPQVSIETKPAPKLAPGKPKLHKSPIQSRPLPPNPDGRPLPPDPVLHEDMSGMPPIYMTADDEDIDTQETDDDEEWTYEPLEQYHIYNM